MRFLYSYLFYYLSHLNLGRSFTGSTIPHIYFKNYCNASFPNISYENQCKIAKKLDEICELIKTKNIQKDKLESLVKSRFVDQMDEAGRDADDLVADGLQAGQELLGAEVAKGVAALDRGDVLGHGVA